jgi:hypothetical protein
MQLNWFFIALKDYLSILEMGNINSIMFLGKEGSRLDLCLGQLTSKFFYIQRKGINREERMLKTLKTFGCL